MNVTPHLVVETVLKHARADIWRDKRPLIPILSLLGKAVLFDFGAVSPPMEHRDFALDLKCRGLFRLPYPVTAFSMVARPTVTPYVYASRPAGGMMVLAADETETLTAVMCTELRDPDGRPAGALPIAVTLRAKIENFQQRDHAADITETTFPLLNDRLMVLVMGSDDEAAAGRMRDHMLLNIIGCMGYTVMLMSKGVVTERIPTPERLNKARARKGRPPIGERYTVTIDTAGSQTIAEEGGGETDITGHRRGSPRPHWRRGHFRTLARGSAGERVVPVAPALVAADPDSETAKAAYRLRESS